jgi:hypothetical protein
MKALLALLVMVAGCGSDEASYRESTTSSGIIIVQDADINPKITQVYVDSAIESLTQDTVSGTPESYSHAPFIDKSIFQNAVKPKITFYLEHDDLCLGENDNDGCHSVVDGVFEIRVLVRESFKCSERTNIIHQLVHYAQWVSGDDVNDSNGLYFGSGMTIELVASYWMYLYWCTPEGEGYNYTNAK